LEQNKKDNAKEKTLIQHNINRFEKENEDMKEFYQKEKHKLEKGIQDHMGYIANLGAYLDYVREDLQK
jgi:hypothetical protein